VTALAKAICEKQVSSREVVRAHIERIAKVNGRVNALTVILEEIAMAETRAADERLAAGHEVGPLHGVPVTIKDNIDLMGSATTQGIVASKNTMPRTDALAAAHRCDTGIASKACRISLRLYVLNSLCSNQTAAAKRIRLRPGPNILGNIEFIFYNLCFIL
jgi:hypothetical protein